MLGADSGVLISSSAYGETSIASGTDFGSGIPRSSTLHILRRCAPGPANRLQLFGWVLGPPVVVVINAQSARNCAV